jgi:hypothetical protein
MTHRNKFINQCIQFLIFFNKKLFFKSIMVKAYFIEIINNVEVDFSFLMVLRYKFKGFIFFFYIERKLIFHINLLIIFKILFKNK